MMLLRSTFYLLDLSLLHVLILLMGFSAGACLDGEVACLDGVGCVSRIKICDGTPQCKDQSDELFCQRKEADDHLCHEDQFMCFSGEDCISRSLVCDGAHDCSDSSDEDICDPHEQCKKEGLYLCGNNQQCLNISRVCDGARDCRDGTDEGGQCEEARRECDSGKCHHICVASPTGASCTCHPGFHKLHNHTCLDIDECEYKEPPLCSHVCQNTPGGYTCSCYHGYRLTDEGKCRVEGSPFFLLAHGGEILGYEMFQNRSLHVNTEDAKLYVKDQDEIKSMALGPDQVLFFSDLGHQKIYSSHLDGDWKAHKKEVINMGLKNPEGMDVDCTTGHLYIADSGRGEILACLGNGDYCTTVVSYLNHPKALVIDQKNRHLYWSDIGDPPQIKRASLDGSGRGTFLSDHVGYASVMVLDYTSDRLYWIDKLSPKLESVWLDGSERQILPIHNLRNPVSIAVFEDRIYWTDLGLNGLFSADKFTGHDIQQEVSGLLGMVILLVMHPALRDSNLTRDTCSGTRCSHMCLPTSDGHRCMCPQDMHLESNNITCQINLDVPRIYLGAKKEILQFPLSSVGYQDNQVRTVIGEGNIHTIPTMSICLKHQALVYSDIIRDVIASINISVDSAFYREKIVYSKNLKAVEKLEVDPVTGNIFWIDVGKKTVEVASLSGTYHTVLLSSEHIIQRPTSIAIDSSHGLLYLSLVGVSPSVLQCSLDGSHCKPLLVEVHHPNDLLLYEGHLYIADDIGGMSRIISVKLTNGGALQWQTYLVQGNGKIINRMAIHDKILYWIEEKATNLFSLNLQNIEEESIVLHDTIPLSSILVSAASKEAETACSSKNGGCSHLCIPVSSNTRVCKCSDGFFLQADNTSCTICKEPSCRCEVNRNCPSTPECHGLLCDVDLCVPLDAVCDGNNDCVDRSDEDSAHCSQTTPRDCGPDHFVCASEECISGQLVCNGHPDCPDASDEGQHCGQDLPQNECPKGYEFHKDTKSCQDVNECEADNGGCSQLCVNTEGGRSCHCSPEFISNTTFCIPPDPRPYFLLLEHTTLTRYDLDHHGEFITICAAEPFLNFDVIMSTGDILGISSTDSKTLLVRTNQNDQKKEVLLSMLGNVASVAYDWLGNNLYISDISIPALIVCPVKLLKEGCHSLLHETTGNVALHPVKGLLFWLSSDSIQMSTMSGKQRRSVVEFDLVSVRSSLVLDQFSDRLYWIDHVKHAVESCSTDGNYRRTILSQLSYKFLSINVFGDDMYFTDEGSKSLNRYNRVTGHTTLLTGDLPFSSQLKVIHPILQNAGSRSGVCLERFCSHLCLLTPEGAVCACPDGWDLINNRTCRNPHMVPLTSTKTSVGLGISKSPLLPRVSSTTHRGNRTTSTPTVTTTTITPKETTTHSPPFKIDNLSTPFPPKMGPTLTRPRMEQTAFTTKVSLSILSVSPCKLVCMNGGTCSYSEDKKMDYCVCSPGYTGFFCNEEGPAEEVLTSGPSEDSPSVIIGVILGSVFTAVVIISCLCYLQHKRDKVHIAEIIHFRPLLSKGHSEDAEELFSERPARTNPQNEEPSHDYEEVSSDVMEDPEGLRWQHSSVSVDSAFVSHSEENDELTSQLIPV